MSKKLRYSANNFVKKGRASCTLKIWLSPSLRAFPSLNSKIRAVFSALRSKASLYGGIFSSLRANNCCYAIQTQEFYHTQFRAILCLGNSRPSLVKGE